MLTRNLIDKVVIPDFRYLESCGRHALARLCARTGDSDEARRWFAD